MPRTLRLVEILDITLGKLEKTILGLAAPEALYDSSIQDRENKCILDTASNFTFTVRLLLPTFTGVIWFLEQERLVKKASIFLLITPMF